MSLHHLCYVIASCGYTAEPVRQDYGYDVSLFTFDAIGQYENGNMFVQLKATDRIKRNSKTGDISFSIAKKDIVTWENESFPVYLVVFDASSEKAYALYLQQYLQKNNLSSATMARNSLVVRLPPSPIDTATIRQWRDDKNKVLNSIGAVQHV